MCFFYDVSKPIFMAATSDYACDNDSVPVRVVFTESAVEHHSRRRTPKSNADRRGSLLGLGPLVTPVEGR